MRFVVDGNIPYAKDALAGMGEVTLLGSSEITPRAVEKADVLWVRSTVKVNEALLGRSAVRFVATATIGIDHLDTAWLDANDIRWTSAPGSNAPSVQLWWAAAVCGLAERRGEKLLERKRVAIVGVGNVGSRVEALARALGAVVRRVDPPRARAEGEDAGFVALDEALPEADIVTLHVPLVEAGPDRTRNLVDAERIARLKEGAIVVNASRGDVLDGKALLAAKADKRLTLLLDVFAGEPEPDPALIAACELATPHIAGHSLDGKAAGTRMVYDATCAWLGVPAKWTPKRSLPPPPLRTLALDTVQSTDEAVVARAVRRFYDVAADDAALRKIVRMAPADRGKAYQRYRASYPEHRELHGLQVELMPPRARAVAALEVLGATLVRRQ